MGERGGVPRSNLSSQSRGGGIKKRLLIIGALTAILVAAGFAQSSRASRTGTCGVISRNPNTWLSLDVSIGTGTNTQGYVVWVTQVRTTSCPFVRRVAILSLRYIVRFGGVGVYNFSTLRQRCVAHGNLYASSYIMHVDCRGGQGALIVYKAWLQ